MMRGQGDGPIRLTYKDDGMKSSANSIMKKMMSRKERSTFESDYDFVKANEQFEHALSHLSDDFHDMKFIGLLIFLCVFISSHLEMSYDDCRDLCVTELPFALSVSWFMCLLVNLGKH